ncbi:unnamed protein product [Rotaria sp. Silwood2]|nr:unnamed protein product [Rotaria sp. Silwood2]CAF2738682.1 unnamed protein product [Rotaria sp. Silwood2]CAF4250800.1 unnamed protein product [Rotaria sp. Silwood2]CAF4369004.1 unnamed protein product [Rotaria sp. Silwood2]
MISISGVSPCLLRYKERRDCQDIEERISHVTDPKRIIIDLYNSVKEGGFVRDWIVGKYTTRPAVANPKHWIEYKPNRYNENIPYMKKEVVPTDLDCHLPTYGYFDIETFQDELHKFGIKCNNYREEWRYILLIDENTRTGPLTMDLIESHVALTHDLIDFDVSNLVLEKKYTYDLGMRIDILQKPYSIELETIVHNIENKEFYVLHTIDDRLTERIEK